MATYQGKILTRSPFYITAAGIGVLEKAELEVYIWSGSSANTPASPNYTITKNALTSTSSTIIFEISELVRDFYNHNRDAYSESLNSFDDVLWVETNLTMTPVTGSELIVNNIYLALDGYGGFIDGSNPQGNVTSVDKIYLLNGEDKLLPVYTNTDGADKVEWLKDSVIIATDDLTTAEASLFSYDKLQYLTNSGDVDEIKIYQGVTLLKTIPIEEVDECKYIPKELKFYDADGALQRIFMFKKSIESLSTKRDSYNSIIGGVSFNQYTYNTKEHQFRNYNVTGQESITLNTGYVGEEQNRVIKQILLSELVWVDDKPVNIKTDSVTYQTRTNDKLINYTISFDYANNVINNIY